MALPAFAALNVSHYLKFIVSDLSVQQTVEYWICVIWVNAYYNLLPLFILHHIVRRTELLDDAIGLKREVQGIVYLYPIIVAFTFSTWQICPWILPIFIHFEYQDFFRFIVPIWILLNRFLYFRMNFMQIRWTIHKFGRIYRDGITLSSTRMRNIVHESTLGRVHDDVESISLTAVSYERKERLNMKRTLTNEAAFGGFMRRLVKEYSSECLLSIIEMTQYKERIYNDQFSEQQRVMSLQTARFNAKLFLKLPPGIPQSHIVYGEDNDDFKDIAAKIFAKYIKRDAIHEINVDCETWRRLTSLIENDTWDTNEEYDNLVHL